MKKIIILFTAVIVNALLVIPTTSAEPNQPNENAKGYWDQDKMRNAIPIQLLIDPKTKEGSIEPANISSTAATSPISGTPWTDGGLAASATGKVFFTLGTKNYVCSGSLVTDGKTDRAIVLTAAHCVYDFATKWAKKWVFVPNYDANPVSCTQNPSNCWVASSLRLRSEFVNARKFNSTAIQHDWAFAVIYPGGSNSSSLPDANSYPLNISGFNSGSTAFAFGYPAANPYSGNDLVYASGAIFNDAQNNNWTWGMNSNMTGGASGGPWISGFDLTTFNGSLSSVNSYKYTNDSTRMYGPKFDSKTTATFNSALSAAVGSNLAVK